jgi:hypothetical protein
MLPAGPAKLWLKTDARWSCSLISLGVITGQTQTPLPLAFPDLFQRPCMMQPFLQRGDAIIPS